MVIGLGSRFKIWDDFCNNHHVTDEGAMVRGSTGESWAGDCFLEA